MKRLANIFIGIFTVLALAGCSEGVESLPETSEGLTFSVTSPDFGKAATRGMSLTDDENISMLYVLVFDENGYFVECQKAEPVDPASFGIDMNTEYKFTVKLQASLNKRILHFIANYDFSANPVTYGTEYSVISNLTVGDSKVAYWQRVVLDGGIYLNDSWDKMPESDRAKLVKIPLVRDFSKVTVDCKEGCNFELTGYTLLNVPDRGSVAPCVMSESSFAVYPANDSDGDDYALNPYVSREYEDLSASYDGNSSVGFEGYLPKNVQIVDTDASAVEWTVPSSSASGTLYLYERPFSNDATSTVILVKGKWTGKGSTGKETYYKIDFVKSADMGLMEYYNILRNFTYAVTITNCTSDGYGSAAEAAVQPASNNFASSVVTQDIINISDGTSRLLISYSDTTVVTENDFTFRFKYVPDITDPNTVDNTVIDTYDKATGKALAGGGAVIKEFDSDREVTGADGWCVCTLTPQTPGDEEKTQTIILYEPAATGGYVKVARTVVMHLRKPYKMGLECDPSSVSTGVGQTFTLNIKVPTGLSEHLFPLEFKMESSANSLTPDVSKSGDTYKSGYMSTWYGASMINSAKSSYGFTKTVTYAEYQAMASTSDNACKIIPCAFKTTKSVSAATVWVQNKYFEFGDGKSTVSFSN